MTSTVNEVSENVLKTIQDVIVPDVRELKVQYGALKEQIAARGMQFYTRTESLQGAIGAQGKQFEAQFKLVLAAIGESRAQAELVNVRLMSSLSERVAVLEARQH